MDNIVKITGSKSGIILRLDPEADWDSIVKDVAEKFKSSAEFWGDAKKAIAFQGRELDEKQQDEILATIQDNCELQIVCVLDENPEREAAFAKALQQEKSGSASAVAEKLQPICFRTIMALVSFSREIFVPVRCWMLRRALSFWEMSITVQR